MKATIKTIVQDKGFGFLTVEGREKDLFFHATRCMGSFQNMKVGDVVIFKSIETGQKGDMAVGVDFA